MRLLSVSKKGERSLQEVVAGGGQDGIATYSKFYTNLSGAVISRKEEKRQRYYQGCVGICLVNIYLCTESDIKFASLAGWFGLAGHHSGI